MKSSPYIISSHRLVRLIAWARLALAWAAMMLFSEDAPRPTRRRIRRYGLLSLDRLERLVRNLVLIRAAQLARRPARRCTFAFAPAGFRRRRRTRQLLRAVAGSRLRRALRDRDPAKRMARLVQALADIETLARRIVRRLPKGLTRVRALVAVRPPHERIRSLAAPARCTCDSS
jgi:hypothetical protein